MNLEHTSETLFPLTVSNIGWWVCA